MEKAITTTGTGMGAPVAPTRTLYDAASGLQTDTQSLDSSGDVTADLHSVYDDFGNVISYTDASGTVTQLSYDLTGRLVSQSDPKATITFVFDGGADHDGSVTSETDSQAGTFTVGYDADGDVTSETYPGGTAAARSYDSTGAATAVSYSNPSWAGSLTDSVVDDAVGDWTTQSQPGSSQNYSYDLADRIVSAADTLNGQCTNRSYAYDADSNRIGLTTGAPNADGSCQTSTTTTETHTYDSADRLIDSGYTYDTLGDTTTTPSVDAGSGGDLTATYYANGMTAGQSQGAASMQWQLDPAQNRTYEYTDSRTGLTYTDHYSDDSDSPSWTSDSSGGWTRNIDGPDGELAGQGSSAGVVLSLVNLHGDVMASVDTGTNQVTATFAYDEFGNAEIGTPGTYGWLGGDQRSDATLGGQILMGSRTYNPTTGRFNQVDPVAGGSCSAYDYVCANPLNQSDLAGTSLKSRSQTECTRLSCVTIQRICDTSTNMRCAVNIWFHWRGSWADAVINIGTKWNLYDDGLYVVSQSYDHAEWGSYNFHGYWYSNNSAKHGRGWFKCYGGTCWVDPGDRLTVIVNGTAWYGDVLEKFSMGESFSGGGYYS